MGSGEKKIVAVLAVVLIGLIAVYVAFQPGGGAARTPTQMPGTRAGSAGAGAASNASGPGCSTTGGGGTGVATQEFGKKGAKLEIAAALPITHGCHVETEAQLKQAYEKHKDAIHLIIYDLFGSEGQAFVADKGGQRAVIFINGKSSFEFKGRPVVFEKQENMSYEPSQIVPVIEQELEKG